MATTALTVALSQPVSWVASWYGAFHAGRRTANGERFRPQDFTCAHKTLPFGTRLRVTWKGRSTVVRINDRGPYINGRDLDLSEAAATALGMRERGVAQVTVELISD